MILRLFGEETASFGNLQEVGFPKLAIWVLGSISAWLGFDFNLLRIIEFGNYFGFLRIQLLSSFCTFLELRIFVWRNLGYQKMTIGNLARKEERESRKAKAIFYDKAPLLPKRQEEDVGFDEFPGASFTGAVFNLSTTIIGAGIMALPATMKMLGLGLGIAMIIFMAVLTDASIEMLLKFSRAGRLTSYGGLMGDAFGKYGRTFLQICVVINNIGVLIVYMIIIGMTFFFHYLVYEICIQIFACEFDI